MSGSGSAAPPPPPSAASLPPPSSSSPSLFPLLLLYGSQTGNAEAIAKELHAELGGDQAGVQLSSMADFVQADGELRSLPSFPLLLVVLSTTGQGDAPDSASKFLRALRKRLQPTSASSSSPSASASASPPPFLSGCQYGVLALGDTNYSNFCKPGLRLDADLSKLGGRRWLAVAAADDATSLQAAVEPWKAEVKRRLRLQADDRRQAQAAVSVYPQSSTASAIQQAQQAMRQLQLSSSQPSQEKSQISALSRQQQRSAQQEDEAKEAEADSSAASSRSSSAAAIVSEERKAVVGESVPGQQQALVAVEQPASLARYLPLRVAVSQPAPSSPSSAAASISSSSSYFDRRWRDVDSDAVLKGYTPDAPFFASLSTARYLTSPGAHAEGRRVVHLELEMTGSSSDTVLYTPGDSIGCYAVNDWRQVQQLCSRLQLCMDDVVEVKSRDEQQRDDDGDGPQAMQAPRVHTAAPSPRSRAMTASPLPAAPPLSGPSSPPAAGGLSHILSPCRVSDLFLYCLDISTAPKKTMLRMLAEWCEAADDKRALYLLASAAQAGRSQYDALLASRRFSLLQLLAAFPSCRPPLAYLLDHLPALQPRYYSVTSSPIPHPTTLHVAFTVLDGGVCTSWLTQLCQHSGLLLDDEYRARAGQPVLGVRRVAASSALQLPMFMRRTQTFTLPSSLSTPLVLVGPGTGVAPFRSFLLHRRHQRAALASGGVAMGWWRGLDLDMEEEREEADDTARALSAHSRFAQQSKRPPIHPPSMTTSGSSSAAPLPSSSSSSSSSSFPVAAPSSSVASSSSLVGETLLFFGCRSADQDFLYRSDFLSLLEDGTLTRLVTAFSREAGGGRVYVQDRMREEGALLHRLLEQERAVLFLCGDGGGMARGVMQAVQSVYCQHGGLSEQQARQRVAELMREKRFVQDIWS